MSDHLEDLYNEESFRDSLATVDKDGKRIWVYPKKPKGRFYQYRKYVSYTLLVILFGLPWIHYNGAPLVQLNFLERYFILFGIHFAPQDFYLFVIATLILIVFIALFTVIFGRLFCGWVCPQTIFMEMVYRRIEYAIEGDANAQKKLNAAPWNLNKGIKKISKQFIFFTIAVLIANTFLAYIIGIDEVLKIITEPISTHWQGFLAMITFSFIFYYVFASLREQVCTTICPYGRLQGVLLDEKSLAVQYDFVRGEPRGKLKRNSTETEGQGDCIDCKLCIQVCPTGIDIRDGIQLECVNCTACIDACDEVMTKINKPIGLIRMDSLLGIKSGIRSLITKRSVAYSLVLLALVIFESFLFVKRSELDILLLRTPGMLYQQPTEGIISNLYNYQIRNKTIKEFDLQLEITNFPEAKIEFVGAPPKTLKNEISSGALFIKIPRDKLKGRKTKLKFRATTNGKELTTFTTNFMGPIQ